MANVIINGLIRLAKNGIGFRLMMMKKINGMTTNMRITRPNMAARINIPRRAYVSCKSPVFASTVVMRLATPMGVNLNIIDKIWNVYNI